MRTVPRWVTSFDGSASRRVLVQEADKIRELEDPTRELRIARGGGFSYAPMSLGEGVFTQSCAHFNRILAFSIEQRTIDVEPGITLGDLFRFTAPHKLYLAVQPGYPAITVGGCLGSNVHGKNPLLEGTFESKVESLTLFHPAHGTRHVDRTTPGDLFALTCGGFGLTGIVRSVKLRLSPLAGSAARIEFVPVSTLAEGYAALRESGATHEFAYTWHNGFTRAGYFGKGFAVRGSVLPGPAPQEKDLPNYWPMKPATRGRGYPPAWNRMSAGLVNALYLPLVGARRVREQDVFHSLFPLYGREKYFHLFGRRGFFEYQVLMSHGRAEAFMDALSLRLLSERAPSIFVALRLFGGTQRYLRFDGTGVSVAVDMPRTSSTEKLMVHLNRLMLDHGGIPFIVKNSSLTADDVRRAFPQYAEFREMLREQDPQRLFRSEQSERLGL